MNVSVIVPVYNTARYLPRFMRSLEDQSYGLEKLEVLFVDDCSKDNSRELVREFCLAHPSAKLLEMEENSGAGAARNRGIEAATGEWLSFLDPDDYVGKEFFSALVAKAKKSQADIVKTGFVSITPQGEFLSKLNRKVAAGVLTGGGNICELLTAEHQSILYRKSLIDAHGLRYGRTRIGEDSSFLLKVGWFAKSIAFVDDPDAAYYYYTSIPGSIMNTVDAEHFRSQLEQVLDRLSFLKSVDGEGRVLCKMFQHGIRVLYKEAAKYDIDSVEGISEAWYLDQVREIVNSFEQGPELVARNYFTRWFYKGNIKRVKRIYRWKQRCAAFRRFLRSKGKDFRI